MGIVHQGIIRRFADQRRSVLGEHMELDVYEKLWRFNRAYQEGGFGLRKLRQHPGFHRKKIDRFAELSKEVRATTNSYLASAIETLETEEAGRRYGKRRRREKQDDEPS